MLIWPETNDVATDLGRAIRRRMYRISKGLNNSAASRERLADGLLVALCKAIHNVRDLFEDWSTGRRNLLVDIRLVPFEDRFREVLEELLVVDLTDKRV